MKMFRKDEGFTLVELMVVVLIIGILVAIAVPIFNAAKASAQKKSCFANQRTIEGAVQSYQAATGTMPAAATVSGTHVLISGGYIKNPPYCPLVGTGGQYALDASGTVSVPAGCTHGLYTAGG
jgi:prepilin-type N-terminal cleavage/methylation domain-containing protein